MTWRRLDAHDEWRAALASDELAQVVRRFDEKSKGSLELGHDVHDNTAEGCARDASSFDAAPAFMVLLLSFL